jgi:hypothetical protein
MSMTGELHLGDVCGASCAPKEELREDVAATVPRPARTVRRSINGNSLTLAGSTQANSLFSAEGDFLTPLMLHRKMTEPFANAAKPYVKAAVHFNPLIGDKE